MEEVSFDLISKYNVQGPRYTSYPTAIQFSEATESGRRHLISYLKERNKGAQPISLYFHIPFCFSLCWYCGCTKVITKDQDRGDLNDYYNALDTKQLPVVKTLQLCKDDMIRKDAIMRIMCRMGLSFNEIEEKWGIVFEEYFSGSLKRLESLQSDGFLKITDNEISITEQGRLFLRNIAMCFDRYLHASKRESSFSKTV